MSLENESLFAEELVDRTAPERPTLDTPESIARDFVDGHMSETHDAETREGIAHGLARWIHLLVKSTHVELVERLADYESRACACSHKEQAEMHRTSAEEWMQRAEAAETKCKDMDAALVRAGLRFNEELARSDSADAEIQRLRKRVDECETELCAFDEHERQTHETLHGILGTGDSLDMLAKALKKRAETADEEIGRLVGVFTAQTIARVQAEEMQENAEHHEAEANLLKDVAIADRDLWEKRAKEAEAKAAALTFVHGQTFVSAMAQSRREGIEACYAALCPRCKAGEPYRPLYDRAPSLAHLGGHTDGYGAPKHVCGAEALRRALLPEAIRGEEVTA